MSLILFFFKIKFNLICYFFAETQTAVSKNRLRLFQSEKAKFRAKVKWIFLRCELRKFREVLTTESRRPIRQCCRRSLFSISRGNFPRQDDTNARDLVHSNEIIIDMSFAEFFFLTNVRFGPF